MSRIQPLNSKSAEPPAISLWWYYWYNNLVHHIPSAKCSYLKFSSGGVYQGRRQMLWKGEAALTCGWQPKKVFSTQYWYTFLQKGKSQCPQALPSSYGPVIYNLKLKSWCIYPAVMVTPSCWGTRFIILEGEPSWFWFKNSQNHKQQAVSQPSCPLFWGQ